MLQPIQKVWKITGSHADWTVTGDDGKQLPPREIPIGPHVQIMESRNWLSVWGIWVLSENKQMTEVPFIKKKKKKPPLSNNIKLEI